MSYVVQWPSSLTNPTDRFRVIDYGKWLRAYPPTNYPVESEHDSYEEAEKAKDILNGRTPKGEGE